MSGKYTEEQVIEKLIFYKNSFIAMKKQIADLTAERDGYKADLETLKTKAIEKSEARLAYDEKLAALIDEADAILADANIATN